MACGPVPTASKRSLRQTSQTQAKGLIQFLKTNFCVFWLPEVANTEKPRAVPRNTVRRILRSGETSFSYERERQPQPKIGPWQVQLDALLDGNDAKAKRERLTLIRIYEELRALGYEGSYDAIRRYAKSRDKARGAAMAEAYVPLFYPPGELATRPSTLCARCRN
jgi:hypothetical protein